MMQNVGHRLIVVVLTPPAFVTMPSSRAFFLVYDKVFVIVGPSLSPSLDPSIRSRVCHSPIFHGTPSFFLHVLCACEISQESVREMVEAMGGTFDGSLTMMTSHLVAACTDTERYKFATGMKVMIFF